MPRTCKLLSIHQCQELANCCSFTSTTILRLFQFSNAQNFQTAINPQTAVNSQVPQSCKLLSVHKYHRPPSCKLLRFERTKSCKLLAIHKYQNLANCCQVTSTAILQTALIRKYQNLENLIHKFTSSNILQTVVNSQVPTSCQPLVTSQVPKSCKLLSIHKCQIRANYLLLSAKCL